MAKHFRFNLLVKKEKAVFTEAVSFLNSYAKYVIVLTQILVLIVFFVKIVLDQTVIDLKETIDQKNQIILTATEMINNNNLTARKLIEISKILKTNDYRYSSLKLVLTNIPKSITVNGIHLQQNKIILEAQGTRPLDIQKMQVRLSNKIKGKVIIDQISKKTSVYYYKLSVNYEEQQG